MSTHSRRQIVVCVMVGFLFAVGLSTSGMTDPEKVLAFLNLLGDWNPALLFVMIAAIPVYAVGWKIAGKRDRPIVDVAWHLPQATAIDRRLVEGAAVFGIGWGLAGLCPGPALVSLSTGAIASFVFAACYVMGVVLENYLTNSAKKPADSA